MTTKAFLKKKGKGDQYPIFIRYSHKGKTADFHTGLKASSNQWLKNKQQVDYTRGITENKTNADTLKELTQLTKITNAAIEAFKAKIRKTATELMLQESEPSHIAVKKRYLELERKKKTNLAPLIEVFDDFIRDAKATKTFLTVKNYKVTKTHLESFFKENKPVSLGELDLKFFDQFRNFLTENNKSQNTIWGHFKNIKAALNYAKDRGAAINIATKDVKAKFEVPDIVYLTPEELIKLWKHNFKENKKLERVRDLFVFQCYTGMRISDLKRIAKHHIHGDLIKIIAHKNQEKSSLTIPLVPISHEILVKYDYKLPIISEQKLNEYIKTACQEAKINSIVEKVSLKKGTKVIENVEKWSMISTHNAVKTFITICKIKNIPVKTVSHITGKSVAIIMKHYEGISDEMVIREMRNAFGDITLKVS